MKEIHVLPDIDSISQAVAEKWRVLSEQAISGHGGFHIALSGGSTPRHLFEFLATSDYSTRIDWSNTHIYFGDERSVPADHKDSNYKMARDSLLERVKIPGSQVYRMPADADDIQNAAEEYSSLLKNKLEEADKLVSAVYVDKMATWRMSLTFPVINNARNIALLVAGDNKKEILAKVLDDTAAAPVYPVQMIQAQGNIDWYIDAAAAKLLSHHG
jgi:6-phosphogluconolactonase